MTAQPKRVVLVGYGLAGEVFHAPLISCATGLRLAAVVTRSAERQRAARARYPDVEILDDVERVWAARDRFDLLVVASPNKTHLPLSLGAIKLRLPVVVDKPLAVTLVEAEQIRAAALASGVPLCVFQNRRWDADFLTVRKLIESQVLGAVYRFESRYERWRPQPVAGAWRESADEGGGLLLDLCSHLLDQTVLLFGAPSHVYAEVLTRRESCTVDDDVFISLRFRAGVQAHLWASAVACLQGPRFRVLGSRGAFEKFGTDPQEDALKRGETPALQQNWGAEPPERFGRLCVDGDASHSSVVPSERGRYQDFYAAVATSLHSGGDRPMPVRVEEAILVMRVLEAARKSAETGAVIRFDEAAK